MYNIQDKNQKLMEVHLPGLGWQLFLKIRKLASHFDIYPIYFFHQKPGKVSGFEATPEEEFAWLQTKSNFHTASYELKRNQQVWHNSMFYKTCTKGLVPRGAEGLQVPRAAGSGSTANDFS